MHFGFSKMAASNKLWSLPLIALFSMALHASSEESSLVVKSPNHFFLSVDGLSKFAATSYDGTFNGFGASMDFGYTFGKNLSLGISGRYLPFFVANTAKPSNTVGMADSWGVFLLYKIGFPILNNSILIEPGIMAGMSVEYHRFFSRNDSLFDDDGQSFDKTATYTKVKYSNSDIGAIFLKVVFGHYFISPVLTYNLLFGGNQTYINDYDKRKMPYTGNPWIESESKFSIHNEAGIGVVLHF